MGDTFRAFGSCTFWFVLSPEAEKLARRKRTMQRRKSMNGMRGMSRLTER
jgi:hypothetical protein